MHLTECDCNEKDCILFFHWNHKNVIAEYVPQNVQNVITDSNLYISELGISHYTSVESKQFAEKNIDMLEGFGQWCTWMTSLCSCHVHTLLHTRKCLATNGRDQISQNHQLVNKWHGSHHLLKPAKQCSERHMILMVLNTRKTKTSK